MSGFGGVGIFAILTSVSSPYLYVLLGILGAVISAIIMAEKLKKLYKCALQFYRYYL
jgi:hypothetical protein